jgi:tRNA (guanine-N7-)-methyltransferase
MITNQIPSHDTLSYDPAVPRELVQGRIVWRNLFGNDAPVEVDVGCGKGRFLIEAASRNPDRNYLGVEKNGRPFYLARERVGKRSLRNVRVLRDDAHRFVAECVPDDSVATYHVYFPDPWPKKKHHKRRLFTPSFVAELARTLATDGILRIATDIADYFEEILLLIEGEPRFVLVKEGRYEEDTYLTNFAAKYRQQGREMLQAVFRIR